MQSTGHSSMQALSFTSTHGSAMTYVTTRGPLGLHSRAGTAPGGTAVAQYAHRRPPASPGVPAHRGPRRRRRHRVSPVLRLPDTRPRQLADIVPATPGAVSYTHLTL